MQTPEAVVAAFQDAWNAHDMTALEGLFRDKADFVNVYGMWWRDRTTIARRHRAAHAGPYAQSLLEGELRSLEMLAPDIALAHVDWRLTVPASPAESGRSRGVMTFVLQRDEEGWRIRAAQNTEKSRR